MDKTIEVKTSAGVVVVKKLAMKDYAELLRALKKLPTELGKFIEGTSKEDLAKNETMFSALPAIIADALPEFCAILAVASDKDADYHLNELDLADNIDVFAAALELNDYKRITAAVKKIMAPTEVPTSQAGPKEPEAPQTPES